MFLMSKKKMDTDWLDQSLKFIPWGGVILLLLYKFKKQSADKREWLTTATSVAVRIGTVEAVKKIADERRPFSFKSNSFPSGHAASAFSAAEVIRNAAKDMHPAVKYSGYALAAA